MLITDGALTNSIKYYFANGERVAERSTANGLLFYHKDHLGSLVKVSDAEGNLLNILMTTPFGEELLIEFIPDLPENIDLITPIVDATEEYKARDTITASSSAEGTSDVSCEAGKTVRLLPGFQTEKGVSFKAAVNYKLRMPSDPCEARYTFTSKELDDTNLYYFGAHYYDPAMGIFISADPAMDGLNWYTYCGNNPMNYVDPWGLMPSDAAAAAAAAIPGWSPQEPVTYNPGNNDNGPTETGLQNTPTTELGSGPTKPSPTTTGPPTDAPVTGGPCDRNSDNYDPADFRNYWNNMNMLRDTIAEMDRNRFWGMIGEAYERAFNFDFGQDSAKAAAEGMHEGDYGKWAAGTVAGALEGLMDAIFVWCLAEMAVEQVGADALYSAGGVGDTTKNNALQKALNIAKSTNNVNTLVAQIDNETNVAFAKHFGRFSHGLTNHYNVYVHVALKNKMVEVVNMHIFVDNNGKVTHFYTTFYD